MKNSMVFIEKDTEERIKKELIGYEKFIPSTNKDGDCFYIKSTGQYCFYIDSKEPSLSTLKNCVSRLIDLLEGLGIGDKY